MIFLYKTGIYAYSLIIRMAAVFNPKATLFVKGRKGWRKKLAGKVENNNRYLWFHCASLGEFEQGRPVIEKVKENHPEYKIILTFFSPSGYEIRNNYQFADIVAYLPTDSPRNARDFLRITNPEKAFFIKYEYWYFYICELNKRKIPLYLISAIFRQNQPFFRNNAWGLWYRKLLFKFNHFFVQNEKSAELLLSVGVTNYTISGDTRFDRVAAIAANSKALPVVEKFRQHFPVIVAGSTWKPDEELLATLINKSNNLKVILAPHEVSEANIKRIQQIVEKRTMRFSELDEAQIETCQVLIIDGIGLLSSLYRYGDIGYIGGGFGVGIHNILEAATFGLPVIFGPNYKKFKEAVELMDRGGAFSVRNSNELDTIIQKLLGKIQKEKSPSVICRKYVESNVGSTNLIINKVFNT